MRNYGIISSESRPWGIDSSQDKALFTQSVCENCEWNDDSQLHTKVGAIRELTINPFL